MAVLEKIRKALSGKQWVSINDPVFGELRRCGGYHTGRVLFTPTGQRVMIQIFISPCQAVGPETILTDRHRGLFRELEGRYAALAPQVASEVLRRYPHYTEDFTAATVWQEFALMDIEIDDVEGWPLGVVLRYKSLTEPAHLVFSLENWKLQVVR